MSYSRSKYINDRSEYTFQCIIYDIDPSSDKGLNKPAVGLKAIDLTDTDRPNEYWIVELDKFKKKDIPKIKPGAMFFFDIINGKGVFTLHELPPMTKAQLKRAKVRYQELCDVFLKEDI